MQKIYTQPPPPPAPDGEGEPSTSPSPTLVTAPDPFVADVLATHPSPNQLPTPTPPIQLPNPPQGPWNIEDSGALELDEIDAASDGSQDGSQDNEGVIFDINKDEVIDQTMQTAEVKENVKADYMTNWYEK